MKVSKLFFLFFIVGLFSTGLFFDNANARTISNYFEENTVCGTTSSTTSPITITDSTEFEFLDGRDYLIVVTSAWNGADNAQTYEIKLQHGSTIFEGSEQIIEPKASGAVCASDTDLYKYFFWTIWNPVGASQASEDIILNFTSLDGISDMLFDDVTIFAMDLSNPLTENTKWFFDEDTTDTALSTNGTGFNTTNSAILSFTPTDNDDDWLIFGNALLSIDDVATQYETRLNFGNETLTPILGKEGEDITEQVVQSFSRVFTLNNTQSHTFKIESRNDGIPVGTNERLYNSIFALNLNSFTFHNSTYIDGALLITQGEFDQNVLTLDTESTTSDTEWFIFGGVTKDNSKKMEMRLQVDNVDEPTGQTSQTYDFGDGWDADDLVPMNFLTIENLTNSAIHTIDVDASMGSNGDQNVRHRSLFAFSLEIPIEIFDDPMSMTDDITITFGRNFTDPMSMTDDITITFGKNFTDPMSMTDDITITFGKNFTDPMSMTDDITITFGKNFTDPMSMTDDITITFGKNLTDPMSMTDDIDLTLVSVRNFTDPMSMTDDTDITLVKKFTDPMSMTDDITITFGKNLTDPMSMTDDTDITLGKDFTDPMSITDDIDLTLVSVRNFIDPMSMTDDTDITLVKTITDPFSWVDSIITTQSITSPHDNPMSMTDDIVLTVVSIKDFIDPMSLIDDIDITLTKTIIDPVSLTDDIDLTLIKKFIDPFSWIDDMQVNISVVKVFQDPVSFTDTAIFTIGKAPIILPPPPSSGVGGGAGSPTPIIADSDGDGILDPDDACPLEPEIFNGFEDADGCPDSIVPTPPIDIDLGFPFGFNELDVIDDFIELDTITPQAQVETLTLRWLGDEPLTINSIQFADSPFEFQVQGLPVRFGNTEFGFSQADLFYTVQEPDRICGNVLALDCLGEVTYEVPVTVSGEIGIETITVVASGTITVDNSPRFNPFLLALIPLIVVPLTAFSLWRRNRTRNPNSKTRSERLKEDKSKPLKSGTTRKLLTESKTNVLGRKTK